jgi:hypothetical protein
MSTCLTGESLAGSRKPRKRRKRRR